MADVSWADDPAVEELERALTVLFRRGNQPRTHERLVARAGISLDRSSYAVLARVDEAGRVRVSELADMLGVDISTASRQVHAVASDGLLVRHPDPRDGRVTILEIAPAGRAALRRIRSARLQRIGELVEGWSARDRAELARLLSRFVGQLEYLDEPAAGVTTA